MTPRTKAAKKHRRPVAGVKRPPISRRRATSIALKRVAEALIDCEAYDDLPAGYSAYWAGSKPKNCWYVLCGAKTQSLDGRRALLCISKETGKVILETEVGGG